MPVTEGRAKELLNKSGWENPTEDFQKNTPKELAKTIPWVIPEVCPKIVGWKKINCAPKSLINLFSSFLRCLRKLSNNIQGWKILIIINPL